MLDFNVVGFKKEFGPSVASRFFLQVYRITTRSGPREQVEF